MKVLNDSTIKQIFKGDQNLFWDALITDAALAYQIKTEPSSLEFIPFVHDEKFGAPDQNLIHCMDKPKDFFFISEDYADSAGDATYLNFDISYGIFYLPVVEESRLKEYYVSPKSISKIFNKLTKEFDPVFIQRCSTFGLLLSNIENNDQGFGEIPNKEELDCFFDIHPEQRIFYVFSRALGRYGVAPIKDNNTLLSSLLMSDGNLYQTTQIMLKEYLLKGLLEQSDQENHQEILSRFHAMEEIVKNTQNENGSIVDLQERITRHILLTLKPEFRFALTRSSLIMSSPKTYSIDHFYLNAFIKNNDLMSEIYNTALNRTKMSLQRILKGENLVNLPFYVNQKGDNQKFTRTELILDHTNNQLLYKKNHEYVVYQENENSFISGKAIPFLNEFRYGDRLIALPEHGSKYTPACNTFIQTARKNGINIPKASIMRISIHFLDQLKMAGNKKLQLPRILVPYFGKSIRCDHLAETWRQVVGDIENLLAQLKEEVSDGRETHLAQKTTSSQFRYMDPEMLKLICDLAKEYQEILTKRKKQEDDPELNHRYIIVTFEIKLVIRYYMQQLLQVHDGLLYLNDRPYSLPVYLMFGPKFFEELIKNVTFRVEIV